MPPATPQRELHERVILGGFPGGLMLLLLLLSRFSRAQLCATPQTAAHRLLCPWDSPGKNTGVGCHFPLQCMKVKSESEVTQLCPTLHDPVDCSLPGSSVHGIFQARVLEWGAIAFSFLGGLVIKNPPASAGDMGSIPGPGRSHMARNNHAHGAQLSLSTLEPMLHNY